MPFIPILQYLIIFLNSHIGIFTKSEQLVLLVVFAHPRGLFFSKICAHSVVATWESAGGEVGVRNGSFIAHIKFYLFIRVIKVFFKLLDKFSILFLICLIFFGNTVVPLLNHFEFLFQFGDFTSEICGLFFMLSPKSTKLSITSLEFRVDFRS